MNASARIDFAILITFITGIISIFYFIAITLLVDSDPTLTGMPESYLSWMIIERLILISIIIVILILVTYILLRQKSFEELEKERPEHKAKMARSKKGIKEDIMRYYRDLGALKIVLKDGVLDAESYNEKKKYLEEMIKQRKKEIQELRE
ncbi:MAG: hypothetical protein V3U72_04400 [Candidatus Aenigmarchaeota archaeon]